MKAKTLLGAVVIMAAAISTQATIVYNSGTITAGSTIPDGSAAGLSVDTGVSGVADLGVGGSGIDYVTVSLNITGGYNGDYVGYLLYTPSSGGTPIASAQLLNRPGLGLGGGSIQNAFGYSTSGMNVTLNDVSSLANINSTQSPTGGGTYNSSGGTLNSTFNGLSTANGTWTLFLADMTQGNGSGTLASWSLTVDEVPEPVTSGLIIFGALAVAVLFWKRKSQAAMK
jgi:subtilisin-like proprotein convertase family protein